MIQWIIDFGPLGPKGVRTDDRRPFAALAAGDCERVLKRTGKLPEPTRSLYEGAASACLAAFHHQPDRWPRAYESLAVVRPHLPRLDCLDRVVYQLLDSMTELHRQYPDAVLTKDSDEQQGGKLSCPRIVRLVPDHGPRQGGYPVRVVGVNLPPTVGIHFGDHYITVDTEHGRQAVVTAPRAGPRVRAVPVWVDGWPHGPEKTPHFRYDRPEPTRSGSATPEPR